VSKRPTYIAFWTCLRPLGHRGRSHGRV